MHQCMHMRVLILPCLPMPLRPSAVWYSRCVEKRERPDCRHPYDSVRLAVGAGSPATRLPVCYKGHGLGVVTRKSLDEHLK